MEDLLIWVDEKDRETGYGEKLLTHREERLHRAFSVFIYDRGSGKMLLHRRADGKYHSGGLWTNACCSHPRKGEQTEAAVLRRLDEELGMKEVRRSSLQELGSFQYYKKYESCAEHEIDHVYFLPVEEAPALSPDPEEIRDICWIRMDDLRQWLSDRPQDFTAWFSRALDLVQRHMQE